MDAIAWCKLCKHSTTKPHPFLAIGFSLCSYHQEQDCIYHRCSIHVRDQRGQMNEQLVNGGNLLHRTSYLGSPAPHSIFAKGWLCFPRCCFVKEPANKPGWWENRQVCRSRMGSSPTCLSSKLFNLLSLPEPTQSKWVMGKGGWRMQGGPSVRL